MASIDRYRPPREGYQPPSLPPKPATSVAPATSSSDRNRYSQSPSSRREVPPAVPSPPTLSSRTSPPRPLSQSQRGHQSPATPSSTAPSKAPVNQWFFNSEQIASTPSILDGMTQAEERTLRAKGVNFIYQVGMIIEPQPFPQLSLWVASTFFHRFYMRHSMVEKKGGIHHYNIAATALFLANKTEENCYKTKNLIIAVAKVAQKNPKLIIDEQSKEYWRWRDSILHYEEVMLETLTFDLMVSHPYQHLYRQLERLDLLHAKRIRHSAWTFLNDCAMSPLPLLMDGVDIASAALFFASNISGEKIEDINGEPWWVYLRANDERIIKAIEVANTFYRENPLKRQDIPELNSPKFTLENSRRRGEPSQEGGSNIGTPLDLDGPATQTPRNGSAGPEPEDEQRIPHRSNGADKPVTSAGIDMSRGDSDAALKVAANDLDHHPGKPAADEDPISAGLKRKSAEPESERPLKKRRESDEDEGEVSEN